MKETKNMIEHLRSIEGEIRACFDGWDGAIKNNAQPVAIQDLDFWSCELLRVVRQLEKEVSQ